MADIIARRFSYTVVVGGIVLVLTMSDAGTQSGSMLFPGTEFRIIMSLAWARQLPDAKAAEDYAAACRERGIKGCGMQILWNKIEPEEEKYSWDWLDERLDAMVNAGQKVHLRLAIRDLPDWVQPEYMCSADGIVLTTNRFRQVSYADKKTMSSIARTMQAVMEHVMAR